MRPFRRWGRSSARRLAKRLVPVLPDFVRLLFGLFRDRRVALADKALLVGVILYVVSPLDLVPDVFGLLGLTDDLFLLGLAVRRLIMGAGEDVIRAHWKGSSGALRDLESGIEDLGGVLPGPVRGALRSWAERR